MLETIIRQVEERTRKKKSLMEGATRKRLSQMHQGAADARHKSALDINSHDANSSDTPAVSRIWGIWRQQKPRRAATVTAEGDHSTVTAGGEHLGILHGTPCSPPKPKPNTSGRPPMPSANCSGHSNGSAHGLKRLLSTTRTRHEWELKKWEWEEAIAESLF